MASETFADQIRQLEIDGQRLISEPKPSASPALKDLVKHRLHDENNHRRSASAIDAFLSSSPTAPTAHVQDLPVSQIKDGTDIGSSLRRSFELSTRAPQISKGTHSPSLSSTFHPSVVSPPKGVFGSAPQLYVAPTAQSHRELHLTSVALDDLRRQISELTQTNQDQKKHFRASTQDLLHRLQEVTVERDRLAAVRATEASEQDELILRLQTAVSELHHTTRSQERTMLDAQKTIETLEGMKSEYNWLMSALHTLLVNGERNQKRQFYEKAPDNSLSASLLIHGLETCLSELRNESDSKTDQIARLELQISELSNALREVGGNTARSADERMQRVTGELEAQLRAADERASNARNQSENLTAQLVMFQEQMKNSERMREEVSKMLEERVNSLKEQMETERHQWGYKLESVSKALDDTQRELASVGAERSDLVRKLAACESRLADYEVTVEKLNNELELERDQTKRLWEHDNETQNRNVDIETKLSLREAELGRLEATLERTKEEFSRRLAQEVALAERYEQEKAAEEKQILAKQVDLLTERHTRAVGELQSIQLEGQRAHQQWQDLSAHFAELNAKCEAAVQEKTTLASQLSVTSDMLNRITTERDQYFNLLNARNGQLEDTQRLAEQHLHQREEAQRQISSLLISTRGLEDRIGLNAQTIERYEKELEVLHSAIAERDARVKDNAMTIDKLSKRMKAKERKLNDLDSERQRLEELLSHRTDSVERLEQEVEAARLEVTECRREVSLLTEERNALKALMKGQEGEMQRHIDGLINKIKDVEHDYKLAKRALRSNETVDEKATTMANRLQIQLTEQRKIADDLRSRLRFLEDRLEVLADEKRCSEAEKLQLEQELGSRSHDNEQRSGDLLAERRKCIALEQKVSSLEAGLKTAISRCASLQDTAERAEQRVHSLKLKHRLDMEELRRSTHHTVGSVSRPLSAPVSLREPPQKSGEQNELCFVPKSGSSIYPADDSLASDLKAVLNDMRNLLNETQSTRLSTQSHSQAHSGALVPDHKTVRIKPSSSHTSSSGGYSRSSVDSLKNHHDSQSKKHSYHSNGQSSNRKDKKVSEPLQTEAQILCKSLEEKLEKLSRIGAQTVGQSAGRSNVSARDGSEQSLSQRRTTTAEQIQKYVRSGSGM